jgi:CRISPR-associated endonuclease/helicase Cas3
MHILLVSACEKKALQRTRRILDSYAIRVGNRTWTSAMTLEGLREVRGLLKRSATRQTAVACYQNDGRRRMKLVWTVGARGTFGPNGHYPSGTTSRGAKAASAEPLSWVRLACKLVEAAGLVHDIGKASIRFQNKLRQSSKEGDDVRHEWLSLRLLHHMRRNGHSWSSAWKDLPSKLDAVILGERTIDSFSVDGISSCREALDFLIVSHHGLLESDERLPTAKGRHIRRFPSDAQISPYGSVSSIILDRYWAIEEVLLSKMDTNDSVFWRGLVAYARAALIFADHVVSSEQINQMIKEAELCANTRREQGARVLNQTLDWHLENVAFKARDVMWRMSQLTSTASDDQLIGLSEEAVTTITRRSDSAGRFAWQNKCAQALSKAREAYPDRAALVFNMAGTGSGKTRMNARAACLLSRHRSPRFSIALNLRSLTLQTGEALKSGLGLGGDEMAIVIGDKTAADLYNWSKSVDAAALSDINNVDENPIEDELSCYGQPQPIPSWMEPLFRKEQERVVVGAPLLVSTIDFLVAAGNPGDQGRHVKAILRLMTSDLVLDEIDGYEPTALCAVLRLVQMSALFRRNVICSSATLSKPVALAIERAYRSGCKMLEHLEGYHKAESSQSSSEGSRIGFIRALIDDDLEPIVAAVEVDADDFGSQYSARLEDINAHLQKKSTYRLADLQQLESESPQQWLEAVRKSVQELHVLNAWRFNEAKSISFGLVRVANISTAITVARHLADHFSDCRVACYHSNDFPISRFHKERALDRLLSRGNGDEHIRNSPDIREIVEKAAGDSVLFIVVATPVEEIGRDHDFDWAVVEPSSAQSIVQTCGRVNRHRLVACGDCPNIKLLQFNYRHCRNVSTGKGDRAAFIFPGFEATPGSRKASRDYLGHDLSRLLLWSDNKLRIDASVRFDTKHFPLARADDRSIERLLLDYFGESGCFVCSPTDVWTLTRGPYDLTRLRDKSFMHQCWRMVISDGVVEFFRKERVEKAGMLMDRWLEDSMVIVPKRRNAWLCLSPEEMAMLCAEVGIPLQDGMEVELAVFSEGERFEFDEGFGIKRVDQ